MRSALPTALLMWKKDIKPIVPVGTAQWTVSSPFSSRLKPSFIVKKQGHFVLPILSLHKNIIRASLSLCPSLVLLLSTLHLLSSVVIVNALSYFEEYVLYSCSPFFLSITSLVLPLYPLVCLPCHVTTIKAPDSYSINNKIALTVFYYKLNKKLWLLCVWSLLGHIFHSKSCIHKSY